MPRSELSVPNRTNLPNYLLDVKGEKVFFKTDQGLAYEVYLAPGADYLPDTAFAPLVKTLGIYQEPTDIVAVYDERIRNTAISGINHFFRNNPTSY